MNKDIELPEGWEIKKLGDILDKITNGASVTQYEDNVGYPISRIETIWNEGIDLKRVKYIKETDVTFVEKYKLQKNDILFSHINSDFHLGKTAIFKDERLNLIHGINLLLLRAKEDVCADFLNYQFKYLRKNGAFAQVAQKSVNQSSLNQSKLKQFDILVPPIKEQRLIVEKIEELFSELDKGIENLKTAQQQLKVYRQAVLKWAFEGKLTNKDVKNGELPKGWKWEKSGSLFKFITSGSRGWAKHYSESGALFLRITNLDFDSLSLDLEPSKIQYVTPPDGTEGIRTKVQEGDFLFSVTGYLGMFAIAPNLTNAYVNQHIALCRPLDGFNKKFVGYWIISHSGGIYHLNNMRKGAVKAGLNLDDIKSFPVPLCPKEEQDDIVSKIESRLTICDKIEETIVTSLKQAQVLRQSILKQAFEGKLVKAKNSQYEAKVVSIASKRDDWQRQVLAGKIIATCHQDKYFGITKFQKTLYLCEQHAQLEFNTHYLKQAAGPLDASFIYPFVREAEASGWFTERKDKTPYYFEPQPGISNLTEEYSRYFSTEKNTTIQFVIDLLKGKNTDESELIATIYAIWNNYLILGKQLDNDSLVSEVYSWSESKAKFKQGSILGTWNWMEEKELVPTGFGDLVNKLT